MVTYYSCCPSDGNTMNVCMYLTGEVVAIKKLKMEKEKEGFPITSLREIHTLLKAQHPNIIAIQVSSHQLFLSSSFQN